MDAQVPVDIGVVSPNKKRGRPKGSTKKIAGLTAINDKRREPAKTRRGIARKPSMRQSRQRATASSLPEDPLVKQESLPNISPNMPQIPWNGSEELIYSNMRQASYDDSPDSELIIHLPATKKLDVKNPEPLPNSNASENRYPQVELFKHEWPLLYQNNPNSFLVILTEMLLAPNPAAAAGSLTVQEAFRIHLSSLSQASSSGFPTLYGMMKTFWLPASSPFFVSKSLSRPMSEYRFFYWNPLPLIDMGLPCPACSTLLQNNGLIRTGPIKVYDINKPFFIIGCEYVCPHRHKYTSIDEVIVRNLPSKLRADFPARIISGSGPDVWDWQGRGVSNVLWKIVVGCLEAGMGRDTILHIIRFVQREQLCVEEAPKNYEEDADADGDIDEEILNEVCGLPEALSTSLTSPSVYPDQPISLPNIDPGWMTQSQIYSQRSWQGSQTWMDVVPASPDSVSPSSYGGSTASTALTSPSSPSMTFRYSPYTRTNPSPLPGSPTSSDHPRYCFKCGLQECRGANERIMCTDLCRDCGRLECRGRNSRRPERPCGDGWV